MFNVLVSFNANYTIEKQSIFFAGEMIDPVMKIFILQNFEFVL